MTDEKVKVVVKNKLTYLWFLSIPIGAVKLYFDYMNAFGENGTNNMSQFGLDAMISVLIMAIGIIMFFKMNMYSHWMNPDHPKQ